MKYSEEFKAQVVDEYLSGETREALSKKYGMPESSVGYWMRLSGKRKLPYENHKYTREELEPFALRWGKGEKIRDLAKEMGITENSLRHQFNSNGLFKWHMEDKNFHVDIEEFPDYDFYVPSDIPITRVVFNGKRYLDITASYCGC